MEIAKRIRWHNVGLSLPFVVGGACLAAPGDVTAVSIPATPYIEAREGTPHLNFDIILHNTTRVARHLVAIKEQLFGPRGDLRQEREINENGHPPALSGFGNLILAPGGYKDLLQPFQDFDAAPAGSTVRINVLLDRLDHAAPPAALTGDAIATVEVTPRAYHPAAYCLPLTGRLLVHDGHDLNSHHRRRDLVATARGDPVRNRNANLFADDFVRVDDQGALYHGAPDRVENWLTFGAWVTAPVTGVVVAAVDGVPDNTFKDGAAIVPPRSERIDPLGFGNHVVIRAADGRASWLLHLEPGTVRVRSGQTVTEGQRLGRVGFSGDALFPHLHYNVTESISYPSQGVPTYFKQFRRLTVPAGSLIAYGDIDTGDIIEPGMDVVKRGLRTACPYE